MVDFTWKGGKPPDQTPRQGDYYGDAAREMEATVKDVAGIRAEMKANIQDRLSRKAAPQAGQQPEPTPEAAQETTPKAPESQKQTGLLNIALAGLMQGIAKAVLDTPETGAEKAPAQPQAGMPAYNPVKAEKTEPTQGIGTDVLAQAREAATGARQQVRQADQSASPDAAKASRQNAGHEQAKREASSQQQR